MDPLLLTFRDDDLERGYRRHLLRGVSNYKCSAVGLLLFLRSIAIIASQPVGDMRAVLCSVAPLAELVFRKTIPESILEKHGTSIQLVLGVSHSFLAVGGAASAVMMYPDSTKIALVLGFTMTQLFTMCWYRLRLVHQVLLNTATVVFGLAIYLDPICVAVDSMGWTSAMMESVCVLDQYFGGLILGSGGIDSDHCRNLGIAACHQVYTFVHVSLGVFLFSCWLWHREKKHRLHYLAHHHHGQDQINEIINSTGGCFLGFMEWMYALILLWQTLMVVTLMRSTGDGVKGGIWNNIAKLVGKKMEL